MSEILSKKEEILKRLLDQGHISFTEMLLFLKDEIRNEIKKEQTNPFRDLIVPKTMQSGLQMNPKYGNPGDYMVTYGNPMATSSSLKTEFTFDEVEKIK